METVQTVPKFSCTAESRSLPVCKDTVPLNHPIADVTFQTETVHQEVTLNDSLALREMPCSRHNHSMQVKHWFQRAALPSGKHQAWFLCETSEKSAWHVKANASRSFFLLSHAVWATGNLGPKFCVLPCFCRVYPPEFICVGPDEKIICFVYGSSDCALIARWQWKSCIRRGFTIISRL